MSLEIFNAIVPLLVVLLTAALSGVFAPWITRRWQDHQKELEIKTSLVDAVSDAVLQFILAMQFAERRASSQEAFDEAYRTWEVKRAGLSGKLRVYFRESTIAKEFEAFSDAVSEFYALAGTFDLGYRAKRIDELKGYFGASATDWTMLFSQSERENNFVNWFSSWWSLRQAALLRKDVIVTKILESRIDILRSATIR